MTTYWPRHVVFDRALPLSETAAGGADPLFTLEAAKRRCTWLIACR